MSKWLTVPQVAADLNFHANTIRKWCHDGVFPGAAKWPDDGPTAEWRIPASDLEALKRERTKSRVPVDNKRIEELMDAALAARASA